MGIQKNEHHKASIIFYNEKHITIEKNNPIYLLLADISQKVHDFAISFFRSTKAKGFFASYLDGIEGLGIKRRDTLIKHFVTIDNIKQASIEELINAGIPRNVAVKIFQKFNKENNE